MINKNTGEKILALGTIIVIIGVVIYFAWPVFSGDNGDIEADLEDDPDKVTIYWFWGVDCPICEEQKEFIERLEEDDDIEVKSFEVYENPDNRDIFQELVEAYDVPIADVPTTFVGENYWVGFDENIREEIEDTIEDCMKTDHCSSPGEKLSES